MIKYAAAVVLLLLLAFAGAVWWTLESSGVAILVTQRVDGTPRRTHVWYVESDGVLWVEAATPVEDRRLRERLWEILQTCLQDRRQAWIMQADGSYRQAQPDDREGPSSMGTHAWLMELNHRRAVNA